MTMLLEFLERHRARHLFRSSHLKGGLRLFISKFISFAPIIFTGLFTELSC